MSEKEEASQSVGSVLRQRRMLRGQSLEAAHQHTRISKKLLEALELDDHKAFPAPVYLRGFLKSYCDFLDIEFEPLWEGIRAASAPVESPAPVEPASDAASEKRPLVLPLTESTFLPVVIFAALVLAGATMWALNSRAPAPATGAEGEAGPGAAREGKEAALRLTATRDVWVRVKTDGTVRFEGRVPSGKSQDWTAKRSFSLQASDPVSIIAELDGEVLDLAAHPAQPDGSITLTLK